ncbi:MAG: hypothetical protein ACR2NR_22045 [Solirubrobacteraceae bacterium]
MRMFASATTRTSGGCFALSADHFELRARECEGLVFVEVRALTDLCEERAEVVGAVDDLTFAEVRLGGVTAQNRSDFSVEVDAQLLPGGHEIKGY